MAGWPAPDADRALREATFRLVTASGGFAGTGFLADGEGRLLTCHHVAAGHDQLQAIDWTGRSWLAQVESLDDDDLAAADLAILRIASEGEVSLRPLPITFQAPGDRFQARVQLADGAAFQDSTPLVGDLLGPAGIAYAHGANHYRLDARAVAGARIVGGMSGAAVWDPEAAAVVGVLAVSANDPNLGGFAIALDNAAGSTRLRALVEGNQAAIARYGSRPNRIGLTALLGAATTRTLERLDARGIARSDRIVPREGFAEALRAFLGGEARALAIASAAGQGKTNLLVQVVNDHPDRPAWLIRAADVGEHDRPQTALNRLLQEAGAPGGLAWPEMAGACPTKPLLLLDGLNETPLPTHRIVDDWLPDLLADAERSGWRVIYTTRRELFAVLPEALRPQVFNLGRYTAGEAAAAAARLGVDERLSEREPLILRIRAEVGGGVRRCEVLRRFVARLLDAPAVRALGIHPETLLDDLTNLALRAASVSDGESIIAPRSDAFFQDRALTTALTEANLLEVVPAGYRFVFDEVADYLHARRVGRELRSGAPLAASPNVAALALEMLMEEGQGDLAAEVAQELARSVEDATHLTSFVALSALGAAPELRPALMTAAQAVAENDELVEDLMYQPDVLERLPAEIAGLIARAAVLLENGYGWREKDVYSELHRHSTLVAARMEFGVRRVVRDLIDRPDEDGAAVLIDWLGDSARLSRDRTKYGSSEATVASFALCMLYAHRERIGLMRLFTDVLLAERPGWSSLMEAIADEETQAFVAWLESLPPADLSARVDWLLRAWSLVLGGQRREDPDWLARAGRALDAVVRELDDEGVAQVLDRAVSLRIPLSGLVSRVRAAAAKGLVSEYLLGQAFRDDLLSLEEVFALAGDGLRDRLAWMIASMWTPESDRPPLAEVVALIRETAGWPDNLGDRVYDLETLLYRVTLAQADASGLSDLVAEQAAHGSERAFTVMMFVGFEPTEEDPGVRAFRRTLAERIVDGLVDHNRTRAAGNVLAMRASIFEAYRPLLARLTAPLSSREVVVLFISQPDALAGSAAALVDAWLAQGRTPADTDAAFLRDVFLPALVASPPDRPVPREVREALRAHLFRDRA